MSNEKMLFRGNSEMFGIWVPMYMGVVLALPIFWGSGVFNPRGGFICLYIISISILQYFLLEQFFLYQISPDRIFIKYPLSFRKKPLQILIKDIDRVLHDPENHGGGIYSTKNYIEITYGKEKSFLLPVSANKKKTIDILEFLESKR